MSPTDIAAVAGAILIALNLLWTIYWSVKVKRDVETALKRADVREIADRVLKLESDYAHLPTHDKLEVLHTRINDVRKELASLSKEVSANNEAVAGLKRSVDILIKHEMGEEQ